MGIISCLFNHLAECVLPIFLILPLAALRHAVACMVVVFMTVLVLTGDYAYLQYLMLAQTVPAFSDEALTWVLCTQAEGQDLRARGCKNIKVLISLPVRTAMAIMLWIFI